jgi:uncharacterized repeat protein (TIGR03803 family)
VNARGISGNAAWGAVFVLLAGCGMERGTMLSPQSALPGRAPFAVSAGSERVLYAFSGGNDGGNAATGLALDAHGNLLGTTVAGGADGCGTAFELSPQASGSWHEAVLHYFTCLADGKNPHGGVTLDAHGNAVGTTVAGGSGVCAGDGCGVVFRLHGRTESVLHAFTGYGDGFGPGSAVAFDAAGRIYGTTPDGGANSEGTVYQLSHSGARWRERTLHAFTGGKDGGVGSLGPLLIDASGSLYGVTEVGGAHAAGTVFRMTPVSQRDWKFSVLYAFKGAPDAASPYGGLIADASGNLYGTTYYGGSSGLGTVYELVKTPRGYRERVLYSFQGGNDGGFSTSTLLLSGTDLYGTTSSGGNGCDCGTIFKLNVNTGKETVLHRFGSAGDGAYPYYGLIADASGNFYGTTVAGGNANQGTVFQYTP